MDVRTAALETRLDAMAAQMRWTRRALAATVCAVIAAAMAGSQSAAPRPAEVRATRFLLVDARGAPLAALEAAPDGMPRLTLAAASSATPRATLRLGPDGTPGLELRDAAGAERIVLEGAGDAPRLRVAGSSGGAITVTSEGGVPRLALSDKDGRDRMWIALRLGSPAVQFLTPQGIARSGLTTFNDDGGVAVISAADGVTPGLVLYGKDRNIVWSAP